MNEITDKTFVVMLKGNYKCWITPQQAEFIKDQLKVQGTRFISMDDLFIKAEDISFILPASEIDREEKIKRGYWQCRDCGRWHPKEEKCGCQGGKY